MEQQELRGDLFAVGITFLMLVFAPYYLKSLYDNNKLMDKLYQAKYIAVQLDKENTNLHYIIQEQDKYSIELEKHVNDLNSSDRLLKDVR